MSNEGRIIAIGDIHGRDDLLGNLLNSVFENFDGMPFIPGLDRLVFLGDMIDRGMNSKGVIARIRQLQTMYGDSVVVLFGNHEQFMIDAYRSEGGHYEREKWRACWHRSNNGGAMTEASFNGFVPDDVLDWVAALPTRYEVPPSESSPGFFFSHAPVPRERRRAQILMGHDFSRDELIWGYSEDEFGFARNFGDKIGVCGHIHALDKDIWTPRFYEHYIFADAGCGCHPEAGLAAIDVVSRKYLFARPYAGGVEVTLRNGATERLVKNRFEAFRGQV